GPHRRQVLAPAPVLLSELQDRASRRPEVLRQVRQGRRGPGMRQVRGQAGAQCQVLWRLRHEGRGAETTGREVSGRVSAGAFDPKGFSGVVPVFPLPNVILFPGMFLPLHIFEPRYREMTADAIRGERLIAMALLKPGWENHYEGRPPIHPIMGMGKIVEQEALKDGRYNLVLLGLV